MNNDVMYNKYIKYKNKYVALKATYLKLFDRNNTSNKNKYINLREQIDLLKEKQFNNILENDTKNKNKYMQLQTNNVANKNKLGNMIGGAITILDPVEPNESNQIFDTFYANTLKKRTDLESQQFQPSNVLEFIGEDFFTLSNIYTYLDYPPHLNPENNHMNSILKKIGMSYPLQDMIQNEYPPTAPITVGNIGDYYIGKTENELNFYDVCCGSLNRLIIPLELAQWKSVIEHCFQVYIINLQHNDPDKFQENLQNIRMYITLMYDIIPNGFSMGLPSLHTDSFFVGDKIKFNDSFFLVSRIYKDTINNMVDTMPTVMIIPKSGTRLTPDYNVKKQPPFINLLQDINRTRNFDVYKTKNNTIAMQDSYTIHTGTINNSGHPVKRDFLRIFFSNKMYPGTCVNLSLASIDDMYNNMYWQNKKFELDNPSSFYTLQLYGIPEYERYWNSSENKFNIKDEDKYISNTECPGLKTSEKIKRWYLSKLKQ